MMSSLYQWVSIPLRYFDLLFQGVFRQNPDRHANPSRPPNRSLYLRQSLVFESLETRRLLTGLAESQLFLYLLNEARHDPVAYQRTENLTIDMSAIVPRQPLAWNHSLAASAHFHSNEMATFNYFSHTSEVTGIQPNQNARENGYPLPTSWPDEANFIESIAAGTSTARDTLRLFINSEGHRNHLMGVGDFFGANREGGVGYAFNDSSRYRHYWTVHLARRQPAENFLTGFVYNDANSNARYDLNEGLANISITVGNQTVRTNAAGGWSILVEPNTNHTVVVQGGPWNTPHRIQVSSQDLNRQIEIRSVSNSTVPRARIDFGSWQNMVVVQPQIPPEVLERFDVNRDGAITSIDALLIINHLNRGGLTPTNPQLRMDVNRDGVITAIDALLVINYLNRSGASNTSPASSRIPEDQLAGSNSIDQSSSIQLPSEDELAYSIDVSFAFDTNESKLGKPASTGGSTSPGRSRTPRMTGY